MPLPVDVDTLPLYLWERWHGIRLNPDEGLERLLPWARLGTLAFWWLLLAYARLAGRQLAGVWGGRLAVAFIACEPMLLAHASLATTDIAVTACLLALVYHYRTGREERWLWRVGVPSVCFAATVLAKASGLIFGPICLLVVELEYLFTTSKMRSRNVNDMPPRHCPLILRPFLHDMAQIVAGGLLLTFLYCGCDWTPEPSFVAWAQRLPDGPTGRAMVWLAEHLCIFSNAGEGLVRQVKHNVRGHGTYLLGRAADRSIWYYFPLALTMKLSIPLLILPVLLAVVRPRALLNWPCLAALALLALSVTYRVQIGIRLVLPLVALAAVGLAAAAVQACYAVPDGAAERETGRVGVFTTARGIKLLFSYSLPLLICAALVWTATAALWVWPHGLCYTNELWGGTRQGYRCLSDSNYDWGQGLRELARWQRQHSDHALDVWYFGSDPSLGSLPVKEIQFQNLAIKKPEDFLLLVRGHYLAVSTSLLYGSMECTLRSNPAAVQAYGQVSTLLHGRHPVDRTTTFIIYDFTELNADKPTSRQVQIEGARRLLTTVSSDLPRGGDW
jgi:hypothetical protein